MAEKKSEKSKESGKKHSSAALYGRIAFYAVVLVVVGGILVFRQDRVAQNERAETSKQWDEALKAAEDGPKGFLRKSELETVGSPTEGDMIEGSEVVDAAQHQLYTWSSPLGSYSLAVHFTKSDDPVVIEIKTVD